MSNNDSASFPPAVDRLRAWIASDDRSQRAIADTLGVFPSSLSQWLNGHARPSLAAAEKVAALTDGRVAVSDWLTDAESADVRSVRARR